MASVQFEQVTKIYPNGHCALQSLNLEIHAGELMAVVGPSGCGKSTFLRVLAGLEDITSGTLWIGRQIANPLSPQARNIAMVFQDYALYPTMTVRENLDFPLKMRKFAAAERTRRVLRVADMLDLAGVLDRLPKELSGGQRQRVAMGRALVREPSVFLLDEPLSNLDAKLRAQVRAEIGDLQQRTGATMVYVTHDQVEAMTLGQRIAVLHHGRLQQLGTPQSVYEQPANAFVAGFTGSPPMNVFSARLEAWSDTEARLWVDQQPVATLRLDHGRPAVGAVMAGIRPEHLHLATEDSHDGFNAIVVTSEYLGHETLLHVHPAGSDKTDAAPWIARLPGVHPFPAGARIRIARVGPEHVRVFGPAGASA